MENKRTLTDAQVLAISIALSAESHVNQFDKSGMPYFLHTSKVMHKLQRYNDLLLMAGGVLHDIVEDRKATYEQLRDLGIPERVIEMVKGVTKIDGETEEEYLAKIMANPDCIKIKLADLEHNSDIRRLKGVTEKDQKRLDKYCKMYNQLKYLV